MDALPAWTRYIPDVLIGAFGLGMAWVLYHLFVTGPRHWREVLDGLAASGYAPVPADDPGVLAALAQQGPRRIGEILYRGRGETPSLRCLRAMARTGEGRTRYVINARRFYRYGGAEGSRANCNETMVVETMPTGLAASFHVNTFEPGQSTAELARIERGLGEPFAGQFFVYAEDPAAEVPAALQAAFADVAAAFQGGRPAFRLDAPNTRFTPTGWALCCDALMNRDQMAELLRVADRLSEGIAVSSSR